MKGFISILIFVLISCNNRTEENKNEEGATISDQPQQPVSNSETCYMKVKGRDTVILMLKQDGNNVNGKMMFDSYQYDGSSGTVNGTTEGEIIKLWYDFFAEGMHSMMEIYFKKENENLIRGMGEMDSKGDTIYYKVPTVIEYSGSEIFEKKDCSMLLWKF